MKVSVPLQKAKHVYYCAILGAIVLVASLLGGFAVAYAAAPTTGIGFQGQLYNAGSPVTGSVNATFKFYDALSGGSQQGGTITKTVSVNSGYFSTSFTASDLSAVDLNQSLWIEVTVEGNTLTPRSAVNSVPFANKAFGAFSYASAPTVGPSGSLYYNSATGQLMVSNGSAWATVATSSGSGSSATTTINGASGPAFTFAIGSSGTDFTIATSTGTVTFNIPTASASNRGLLSSADFLRIPSSASSSEWASFFAAPSSRITAGTNLSWSGNTLNFNGMLGVSNGGTGTTTAPTFGQLLMGNGSGGYSLVATSSLGISAGGSGTVNSGTAGQLAFYASNGTAVSGTSTILISAGNAGIGTSTPGYKLTVDGDISLTGALRIAGNAGTSGMVLQTTGTGVQWVATSSLGISGGPGGSGNSAFTIGSGRIYNATSTDLVSVGTSSGNTTFFIQGKGGTDPFAIASSTGSTLVLVTQDGRLGVGTTTPVGTLAVQGPVTSSAIAPFALHVVGGTSNSIGQNIYLEGGAGTGAVTLKGGGSLSGGYDAGGITIAGGDSTNSNAVGGSVSITAGNSSLFTAGNVTISPGLGTGGAYGNVILAGSGGKVGIGTSSPSQALTVAGGLRLSGAFFDSTNASGTSGMVLQTTGTGTRWVATSTLGILAGGSGNSAFTIGNGVIYNATSTDLVGIGTSSPSTSLFIQGKGGTNPFAIASSTGAQMLTFSQGGNLGFGSTTPGATLSGPLSSTFSIAASSPAQVASSVAGNSLTINAANAVAGSSNAGAAAGGSLILTAGNAALLTSGTAAGGDVTISAGIGIGTGGQNGSVTINAGSGGTNNHGGTLNLNGGAASGGGTGGAVNITAGSGGASGGAVNITSGAVGGSNSSSGAVTISVADVSTNTTNPGVLTLRGGRSNYSTNTNAYGAGGALNILTQAAATSSSAVLPSSAGGAMTLTLGAGGGNTGSGGVAGTGGAFSVVGGSGGLSTASTGGTGGAGSSLTFISGAGGSALGTSGSRIGGNSGDIILQIGAVGMGSTTNGSFGNVLLAPTGGKVGIGTSTPSQALSIAGNMQLTGAFFDSTNASGTSGMVLLSTGTGTQWVATSSLGISGGPGGSGNSAFTIGNGVIYNATSTNLVGIGTSSPSTTLFIQGKGGTDPFAIASSTGAQMLTFTQAGFMGIGTTTPGSRLDIWGNLNVSTSSRSMLFVDTSTSRVGFGTTTGASTFTFQGIAGTNPFAIASSTGVSLLTLTQAGFLGIGTSSPAGTLSVTGSSYFDGSATFSSSTATTTLVGGLMVGGGSLRYDWSTGVTSIDSVELGALNFAADGGILSWADMDVTTAVATSTVESYSAQIDSNPVLTIYGEAAGGGNVQNLRVGIGTTTPGSTLDVWGNLNVGTSAASALFVNTATTRVGIGTTTPGQSLVVVGNAQFTGVTSGAYSTDLNLTSDGTLTTSASDERLKENLQAISSTTMPSIMQLKPYTFNWKSDDQHRTDIGLIAQDVEKIFPELVFTNPNDGFKGVNYSRLSVFLIKGMQELQVQVDELKNYATFIRTKELHTEKLCVGDESDEVCINKQQLQQILNNSNVQPAPAPAPDPAPVPVPTPDPEPVPADEQGTSSEAVVTDGTSDTGDQGSDGASDPASDPLPASSQDPAPAPAPEPAPDPAPAPAADGGAAQS